MDDSYATAENAGYEPDGYDDVDGATEDDEREDTHLIFSLDGDEYAISVAHIKEVVRLPEFREVPDVPEFIRGVMNLRGRVVPLMDSWTRLGLGTPTYTNRTIVIVLESEGALTGLVADGVSGVCVFPPDTIEPYAYGQSGRARSVLGVGRHDDTTALILDIPRLLGLEDLDPLRTETPSQLQSA